MQCTYMTQLKYECRAYIPKLLLNILHIYESTDSNMIQKRFLHYIIATDAIIAIIFPIVLFLGICFVNLVTLFAYFRDDDYRLLPTFL